MDVVHILAFPDVPEQRVVFEDVQGVPADLRHLQSLVRKVGFQRADLAFHKAETRVLAVLVAFFKQKLHPKADAQQRLLLGLLLNDRHKAGGGELRHGVAEGPHAGQDQPVRCPDHGRVRRDDGFLPQMGKARLQAEQVAHTIIDDRDHTSSPFVEGISSRWAASIFTAAASACPAPLKQASRM